MNKNKWMIVIGLALSMNAFADTQNGKLQLLTVSVEGQESAMISIMGAPAKTLFEKMTAVQEETQQLGPDKFVFKKGETAGFTCFYSVEKSKTKYACIVGLEDLAHGRIDN